MFRRLEEALLVEGLSKKAQHFHNLIKSILRAKPVRLLQFVMAPIEGVFDILAIAESSTPKGEMKELARGRTHRVVAARFPTIDSDNLFLYIVVPLTDMSGEEIKDKQALSALASRLKSIHTDSQKGVPESQLDLDSIFKDRHAAIEKLQAIDKDIVAAGENPAKVVMRDPVRGTISQLISQFYPDKAQKYIAALAALDKGTLERLLTQFAWGPDTQTMLTRMAAATIADRDLGDPKTVKTIAGLALAVMATQALEAEEAA